MSDSWPVCHNDGLPAVCFGADLADPKHRCPRCCREETFTEHGRDNYLSHVVAEGIDGFGVDT